MKATVNESCIACGLCTGICADVFEMGGDGMAHGSEFDESLFAPVEEARDSCPVSAISIEE